MHCSWATRLSPCNPKGHSTLPAASGLLAWPSWLSPTAVGGVFGGDRLVVLALHTWRCQWWR